MSTVRPSLLRLCSSDLKRFLRFCCKGSELNKDSGRPRLPLQGGPAKRV